MSLRIVYVKGGGVPTRTPIFLQTLILWFSVDRVLIDGIRARFVYGVVKIASQHLVIVSPPDW